MHFASSRVEAQKNRYLQRRVIATRRQLAGAKSAALHGAYDDLLGHYQRMATLYGTRERVEYKSPKDAQPIATHLGPEEAERSEARVPDEPTTNMPTAGTALGQTGNILKDAFPLSQDGTFAELLQAIQ